MRVVIYPGVEDVISTVNETAQEIKTHVLKHVEGRHYVSIDWMSGPQEVK